jgi:hypothetical protein
LTLLTAVAAPSPQALGAEWTEPVAVSSGGEAYSPAAAAVPGGPALVAWSRSDGSADSVQTAFAAEGVDFAAPVTVSSGASAFAPAVSLDSAGEAVVAWQQPDGSRSRIYAAEGTGGSFDAPVALSASGAHAFRPHVAIAADGTAVVVWQVASGPVQAAIRRPGGDFSPPQTLSGANQALEPHVAALGSGAAVAAWRRWDGTRFRIEAALLAAGAAGFGAGTALSPTDGSAFAPAVAGNSAGVAVVAWREMGANSRIQAATRAAGGAFGSPETLSAASGQAFGPRIALAANGSVLATWHRSSGALPQVEAALRPAGGSFGPANPVSGGAGAFDPVPAWGPAGEAVLAWSQSAGQRYEVQSATRPAGGAFQPSVRLSAAGVASTEPAVAPADSLFAWVERSGGVRIEASRRVATDEPDPGSGPGPEPPPGAGPPGPQGPVTVPPAQLARLDTTPPRIMSARVTKHGARLRVRLSEPAGLAITVERLTGRAKRAIAVLHKQGKRGLNTIRLAKRSKGRRLPPGRYRAVVRATDASGNASKRLAAVFRIPKAPTG